MFHQNLTLWKSKSPVISWITELFLLGCPDGLEPSTFRTTSNYTDFQQSPLYIAVSEDCENHVCGYFAAICISS